METITIANPLQLQLQWKQFYLGILQLLSQFDPFLEEHKKVIEMLPPGILHASLKTQGMSLFS